MITDEQFAAWLRRPNANRLVLLELEHSVSGDPVSVYIASAPYTSQPDATPSNTPYIDVISQSLALTLRMDGKVSIGEIRIVNDESLNDWIGYNWAGQTVRMYIGDPDWHRDDFRLKGLFKNRGISSWSSGEIVFNVVDLIEQLKRPIDTGTLPDGNPVPLILGHVFNVPAIRIDTATLKYRVSALAVSSVTARDLGSTVTHTPDYANGAFTLSVYTPRPVTAEVWEAHNTPTSVVEYVAAEYGLSVPVSLSLPDYEIGMYFQTPPNGIEIMERLCASIGAGWWVEPNGDLVVRQYVEPTEPTETIDEDDIELGGLRMVRTDEPVSVLRYRFFQNHAVLKEIAGSIEGTDPALADRLQREWTSIEITNSTTDYPLAVAREVNSVISNATDADAEATRQASLRAVPRHIWEIRGFQPFVNVGETVMLAHRFRTGPALVITTTRNPVGESSTIELWMSGAIGGGS